MHRLSKSFVDVAREHKVDLPMNVTEKLCGFCSVVLIPSLTCQVRLRSRSRRSKVNRVGKEHLKNQLVSMS
jgi:RNase P subunit RPR2